MPRIIQKEIEKLIIRQEEEIFLKELKELYPNYNLDNWEIGTDTNFRVSYFTRCGCNKALFNRHLKYLDEITIKTITAYENEEIDVCDYKIQMFLHTTILKSILDVCKNYGWTISKNWIIK